jgi:hypothetical protein
VDAGVRYYSYLLKRFNGDPYKAAMAYNMGPNGLQEALKTGQYPQETREYAAKFHSYINSERPQIMTENPPPQKSWGNQQLDYLQKLENILPGLEEKRMDAKRRGLPDPLPHLPMISDLKPEPKETPGPGDFKPVTNADRPATVQKEGIGDVVSSAWQGVQGATERMKDIQYAMMQYPLEGMNAVLGAGQRAVQGAGAEQAEDFHKLQSGQGDATKMAMTAPFRQAYHAAVSVLHPNDQELMGKDYQDVMDELHIPTHQTQDFFDKLKDPKALGLMAAVNPFGAVSMAAFNQLPEDIKEKTYAFAAQFGEQTATDPTTYLPLLGEFSMGARAVKMLDMMGDAAKADPEISAMLKQAAKMARTTTKNNVTQTARWSGSLSHKLLATRPELDQYLTNPVSKAARLSIEESALTHEHHMNDRDLQILQQNKPAIDAWRPGTQGLIDQIRSAPTANEIPAETRAFLQKHNLNAETLHFFTQNQGIKGAGDAELGELLKNFGVKSMPIPRDVELLNLREPWQHGDIRMRNAAIKAGFNPQEAVQHGILTPEEAKLPPSGALHYNVAQDYDTLIAPKSGQKWEDTPVMKTVGGQHKKEFAGMEKFRSNDGQLPGDAFDRWKNRLELGHALVRQRATDAATKDFLSKYGGWLGEDTTENKEEALDNVIKNLSHSPKQFLLSGKLPGWLVGERNIKLTNAPLRKLSDYQKTAITFNFGPHGIRNVGQLTELAGGPKAFAQGLVYAKQGLGMGDATAEAEKVQRLERMGIAPNYVHELQGPIKDFAEKHPKLQAIQQWNQHQLMRLELGYRQSLLDQLDKELGPSSLDHASPHYNPPLEYAKAQVIRDAIGDYRNINALVAGVRAIGGGFPTFRLGVVPKAVGQAMARVPGRVQRYVRAQDDFNQQFMGDQDSEGVFGGPVQSMEELTSNPLSYMTSPATLGPWGLLRPFLPGQTLGAGRLAQDIFGMAVPEGYAAGDLGAFSGIGGYSPAPGVPWWQNLLGMPLGSYYQQKPSAKSLKKFERSESFANQ